MNFFVKLIYINWPLQILILVTALFGFLMLYSVSGGSWDPWTKPQINRFLISFLLIFVMSVISISFWQKISPLSYVLGLALLIAVYFFGETGMGAKRWLDLKLVKLQPSEAFKISIVMALASCK
jgi:rod shape determining protein RodA